METFSDFIMFIRFVKRKSQDHAYGIGKYKLFVTTKKVL